MKTKRSKLVRRIGRPARKIRTLPVISLLLLSIWIAAAWVNFDSIKAQTSENENGLQSEYFNNTNLSGNPVLRRIDPDIDVNWNNIPAPPGVNNNNFSVRWTGFVKAPTSGLYRFQTVTDDGVRLWINGQLVIDNWTNHAPARDLSDFIKLIQDRKYQIKMEYFQGTGGAVTQLQWNQPGTKPISIPQALLYPAGTDAPTPTPTPAPTASPTPTPATGTTYLADMRPDGSVTSSGSGASTLRLSADERSAVIRFNFANLTTPVNAAHIHGLANPGENAPIMFDFDTAPRASDGSYLWTFAPLGGLSVEQIVDGIKNGRIYINVHTTQFPSGEIRGHYHRVNGSSVFTPPPSVPTPPLGPISSQDAARFLTQSSFGVTPLELSRVQQLRFEAYLNAQFNAPVTPHVAYLIASERPGQHLDTRSTMESFWQKAVTGDDQLRQRVVFALSEIFVVSDASGMGVDQPYALSSYLDVLQNDAFGNFRDLLKDVTLNPAMGVYLSMRQNDREDARTGRIPNENYAREVNQLFSIGLYQLHPDGTLVLDANGQPIPTYDQSTIIGFAHVFTGWNFGSIRTNENNWRDYFESWDNNSHQTWIVPMQPWENHHSQASKKLLNGITLPAGQSARRDLEMAIDNIFNHPNVGPFICRQLIQRLVMSNPSPGYVYRVASVFNDNGQGVRGDMKAVIRAILLDYEARSPESINQQGYGKQREPVLRLSALLRAFNGHGANGRFQLWNLESPIWALGQNPLRAPNVFNFFEPSYAPPGAISAAGLTSPEFKITDDTQIIGSTNTSSWMIYGDGINGVTLDLSNLLPLANNPADLVDNLNLLLMSGQMSPAMRNIIVSTVNQVPASDSGWRVKMAIHLIVTSPQFAIQK